MYSLKITAEKILEGENFPAGLMIGDTFTYKHKTLSDFCPWAFHEMTPVLFTLEYGGSFPWIDEGTATMCCSDAKNPVVFKIERLEEYKIEDVYDEVHLKKE